MRIISSLPGMTRLARGWLGRKRVALVPTMGYLHEGHISLVKEARRQVGPRGIVVVSIYVNPTQFGPKEDFARYPRDLKRDAQLCRAAGVDIIFTPDDKAMYPGKAEGRYSTYVVEESLSRWMEGASRPGHFKGVTTIVAKLFNIVLPEVSIFGAKDFQQAAIIRRMVNDLNMPLRIVVAPTLRESDGLAMSSRNKYLEGELRTEARCLWQALQAARQAVRKNRKRIRATTLKSQLQKQIETAPAAKVDYIEFFNRETLAPVEFVDRTSHMALAVKIGRTRLIDNAAMGQ